jgi:polysaccharide pyruvyl transferase WcaK-like protein
MINILIPEETPSLNRGEAAIFLGMRESFKLLSKDVRIAMFSFDPVEDATCYGPDVKIIDARGIMPSSIMYKTHGVLFKVTEYLTFAVKHLIFILIYFLMRDNTSKILKRDVWKHYCQADVVILGHDSAFTPIYHCFLIFFFKYLKKITVIYGASLPSINQISSKYKRAAYARIIRAAFSRVDLITLRERISLRYLKQIGVDGVPSKVTADLAFLMPAAPTLRIDEILVKEALNISDPLVGVAVSRNKMKFAFADSRPLEEKEKNFVSEMTKVVNYLTEVLGATVVFIPHSMVKDQYRHDRILARKILKQVQNKERIRLIESEYSAAELKGLTGRLSFCIGTRLHFIIDAISMLVPFIIITDRFDQRIHGIIGEILEQEKLIYNIENLDYKKISTKIKKYWKKRNLIRSELESYREKLIKDAMSNAEYLKTVVRDRMNNNI